jgi:hypothetical protein
MQQVEILFAINFSSTCFGRLYAHHQEVRLRFTAYAFLSRCNCFDVGESAGKLCELCGVGCLTVCNLLHTVHTVKQPTPHSAHSPATYSTQCTQSSDLLHTVHTVKQPTPHIAHSPATYSTQCTQSSNLLHTVHTACQPTLQHHNSCNRTDNHKQ